MARARHFEWKWLILGGLIIAALAAAIFLNTNVTDYSANKIMSSIAVDNSDLKINWDRYQTVDIELSETLNISESGTYHLTGSLHDGQVIIDAGVGEVRLILDNVNINNYTGPAILCHNAENLVIELVGNSTLSDGNTYSATYDEDIDGTIYSKGDLAFSGIGTLNILANYKDAIVGKDDVKFNSGNYYITTADDAIRGKDSVYIVDGNFEITSTGDAIKSSNENDHGKGFVLVESGNISIVAGAKGINSVNSILIYSGDLNIESYDDSVHSDNYVGIVGGNLEINAGDDGIHADREFIVDGGTINIVKSYEGLEAQIINLNDGSISIISSDDGINAGGGADSSGTNHPGADPFKADENALVNINGGSIYINASGDGIDSNGFLNFNDGNVIVDGPTDNGNGALDSGLGIEIQGGTVIAVGSSGMAESLGANSGICNLSIYFDSLQPADTNVRIQDSSANTVIEHTSAKTFSHLAAGSKALVPGETYTIYLNEEPYQTFTISEVTTTIGKDNFPNHFRL
ncbi:MAG: carbohydrate-binding domain-containing protein [Candidatus Saccharibacteria bacterium]|nr:carbohydrate-binding domain-containing protein [Candidatus Saccharibacteria bacterium]